MKTSCPFSDREPYFNRFVNEIFFKDHEQMGVSLNSLDIFNRYFKGENKILVNDPSK